MSESLPLSRFKVLDLTRVRSGPTAARQFADWGAQVLMIEPPEAGEGLGGARSAGDFQNLHRNKQSLTLDLKAPDGRAIFLKLVQDADVLIENYRPDVKQRLGIDFDTLHKLNPRLVYGSISGFGEDGPYRDRPGLDQIVQGMGGLMSVTGLPGQGPVRAGIAVADSAAGLFCAIGIMTALLEREVTGVGRWVRTSLLQAQIAMLDFQAARWLVDGEVPVQEGNQHPTAVPMGLFATLDGHVNLAAAGGAMFERFCEVAGVSGWLEDPRFATNAKRYTNRVVLRDAIADLIKARPSAYWIEALNAAGVPCGPVYAVDEMFEDPQVRSLKMSTPVTSKALGDISLVAQPISFAGEDFALRCAAPERGEQTHAILMDLGYSAEAIEDLRARKIV